MPFYTVHHITQLSKQQKDELAEAITQIHSKLFTTPRLFVNVIYTNLAPATIYIGGKPKLADMIQVQTRTGPSRTNEHYLQLIDELRAAWAKSVPDVVLDRVIIGGAFIAGMEAGVILPQAGEDETWLKKNWPVFVKRAEAGDEDAQGVIDDVKSRGLIPS